MHGQEGATAQQLQRLQRVRRAEVDVAPGGVKGTDLQHHQIEGAHAVADAGVLIGQARVAAEEHTMPRPAHHQRRPQRRVAVLQPTAAEMLRRCRGHFHLGARQAMALPPVQFSDARRLNAPGLQVRPHAQAGDEGQLGLGQSAHRGMAQVVVVVVRDQHRVQLRQGLQRHRHGLKALGPGELRRRCTLAPHGVGQHTRAVDLHQHRAVAQPGGAQARVGALEPARARVLRRQWHGRHASCAAADEVGQRRHLGRGVAQPGADGREVAKAALGPQRAGLHALQAQALGTGSQGLHRWSPASVFTGTRRSGAAGVSARRRWPPSCTGRP